MRGEHSAVSPSALQRPGSSPHARGALRVHAESRRRQGIIPACAGSTKRVDVIAHCAQDHPRMRGEHALSQLFLVLLEGSSPHARGARRHGLVSGRLAGIIPACAGSTHHCS